MGYILPVALAFCRSDVLLALRNLEWQLELGCRYPEIFLSYDKLTGEAEVRKVEETARRVYETVTRFCYEPPRGNWWPPNQAFQETANFMARQDKSWFWHEADCIPLQTDWLRILSERYHRCGKQFYCPFIPDLEHYNGTGVYPHDTPKLIPRTMNDGAAAWDVNMKPEMSHRGADASNVLYHAWTVDADGRFHPYQGGCPPVFTSREQFRQIPPSAVLFHRDKSASIIPILRECKNEM